VPPPVLYICVEKMYVHSSKTDQHFCDHGTHVYFIVKIISSESWLQSTGSYRVLCYYIMILQYIGSRINIFICLFIDEFNVPLGGGRIIRYEVIH